jgi:hypothetical protein
MNGTEGSGAHAALFRIVVGGRVGFIDAAGVTRIAPELDEASAFSEGLAVAKRGAVWGFIDTDGKWAIDAQFERAWPFSEGVARVLVEVPGERGGPPVGDESEIIDRGGATVRRNVASTLDGDMHDGLMRVRVPGGAKNVGYVRRGGSLAFAVEAEACGDFHEGRAWFSRGGAWRKTSYLLNGSRTEGSTFMQGPHGYLDASGAELIPASCDSAESFSEGVAVVRRGATWVERPYAYERPGLRIAESVTWTLSGGGYGYVARDGSMAIDCVFGHARRFAAGRAPVYVGGAWRDEPLERDGVTMIAHVLRGGHYGFIDPTGRTVIDAAWEDAHPFSGGLARVLMKGRWGYIDRSGDVRITPHFTEACDFEGGLARVGIGAEWGWIRRDGEWVWRSG